MKVITTTTTIASYCEEMEEEKLVINRDYQRSHKVWPVKAKSYLIDTILLGFPVPKLSLYQKTDLRSRKTIKEIVDGQQRSMTIFEFSKDKFKITGDSEFSGRNFSNLEEDQQAAFLEYQLSLDLFVGATMEQIRQVFRRINSYNVPLNRQELRHATFQGEFKWFIVRLVERYAQSLKDIGAFKESQLSRMKDANLLTEIIDAAENGIVSASDTKLDDFYKEHDKLFELKEEYASLVDRAFDYLLEWNEIHNSPVVKPYNLYTLFLALMHHMRPFDSLQEEYMVDEPQVIDSGATLQSLSEVADVLSEPERADTDFNDFTEANSKATNRIGPRKTRFKFLCSRIKLQH
ncbi:MAG: DUF262 domain-containing protein [Bacteroidota bacterium]